MSTTEKSLTKEKQLRTNFENESKSLKSEVEKLQSILKETNHKLAVELKELVAKHIHEETCKELGELKSLKAQLDDVSVFSSFFLFEWCYI